MHISSETRKSGVGLSINDGTFVGSSAYNNEEIHNSAHYSSERKWFTSISGYKIQSEDSPPPSNEPDSSSFETFDEYDDGVEDDVPF